MKVSRIEAYGRELSLQEFMHIIEVLGIDALRGTYELDQILGIASDYAQSLKTAILDAIEGLESAHKALIYGLSSADETIIGPTAQLMPSSGALDFCHA